MDLKTLGKYEKLNQIRLTDSERQTVMAYFAARENDEKALNGCNTDNTERMVFVMPLTNVLREDVSSQPFTRESLLSGAPEQTDGYWQVPRLVD